MTDPVPELPPPLPVAKPKRTGWPKGKPRGKKPIPAELKAEEFAGLTENSCCDACQPDNCVISGTLMPAAKDRFGNPIPASTICGHPGKTPINVIIGNAAAVDRYQRAKKVLQHMVVDARGKNR